MIFSIGSQIWPGLSKVAEEFGEVLQVIGKLMGTGGALTHWDGSNLEVRLCEEFGDSLAAIEFVIDQNGLDRDVIMQRKDKKLARFQSWHRNQS